MILLFTSYVFIYETKDGCYTTMATNRLCQIIEVADQENLATQLLRIERAILNNININTYPHLPIGARCRIISEPMKLKE
jgi:hypothetical protein